MLFAPAADRNKVPILDVLRRVLPAHGTVLEVASGTGQHVTHFAGALPNLYWLPSDPDPAYRASIAGYVRQAGLGNVAPPLDLDVSSVWPVLEVDAVIVVNLLHVAPREVLPALCTGAASRLVAGGILHVYGPFRRGGRHTSEGNARFDESLREQDPRWGIWDVEDVVDTAKGCGFELEEIIDMPANNLSLVLRFGV